MNSSLLKLPLSLLVLVCSNASAVDIFNIQGTGHLSPFDNQVVGTQGVVTAIQNNGFYLQDPIGDGNEATSDGIFVFTGTTRLGTLTSNGLVVGSGVSVNGLVKEFLPGGASTNLTFTEYDLSSSATSILAQVTVGATTSVPAPLILGTGGRVAPVSVISNGPVSGSFNPSAEGIDFYESLEGMRVTLPNATAVGTRNQFGEVYAVANQGTNATGINARGGITISAGDFNPERLQIDDTLASTPIGVSAGQSLGNVTGVISYNFANYELLTTAAVTNTGSAPIQEVTALAPAADRLTVASFNVLNLDPGDATTKFAALATQIVNNLQRPDIIALQEVQDNNGATNNGVTDASQTYQTLINAIVAAGGPTYSFTDVAPSNNADGGEPGGNIRVGYLYNDARVDLVPGSVLRVPGASSDPAFVDSRKPLLGEFLFNGETITVINNHLKSKSGDNPLFGAAQPPIEVTLPQRVDQAEFLNDYLNALLVADPNAKLILLGDLNDFNFSDALQALAGDAGQEVLFNLGDALDPNDRYSFNFEGNSQQLDHLFVTRALLDGSAPLFDIVHTNTGLLGAPSDHDPILASFHIAPVPLPAAVWLFASALAGLLGFARRHAACGAEQKQAN